MKRQLPRSRATSLIATTSLALAMLVLLSGCASDFAKGKKAYNKREYDLAIQYFNADGSADAKDWAASAATAKELETNLREGVMARRKGDLATALGRFQKAVELEKQITHLSKYLKTRMAGIKIELVQTFVEQIRKAKQEKEYESIVSMKDKVATYMTPEDRYYKEIQDIISFAENELKVMKRYDRKGDKLLEEGDKKGAMDAWRMALSHAGATHQPGIQKKLYALEQEVEGGVRDMFDSHISTSRRALDAGEYQKSFDEAQAAIEVTQKNPDITLDAGLAFRYKRLAEENLKEMELAAAKKKAEEERQAAIRAYIAKHGKPMTPTVIDYSKENKVTAKGKGTVKKGKNDRWYASALIDPGAYRKLYVRVPEGKDVIVTRSPDKQEKKDDIVTRTFIDQGYIYYIVENMEGGRFYTVVTNPNGGDDKYEADATLYHELDK